MVRQHHRINGHEFEQALEIAIDKGDWCAAIHGVVYFVKFNPHIHAYFFQRFIEKILNLPKVERNISANGLDHTINISLCYAQSLSHVQLFATPWTVARQASLSMWILQAKILEWVAMIIENIYTITYLFTYSCIHPARLLF